MWFLSSCRKSVVPSILEAKMVTAKVWKLAKRPEGMPKKEDFVCVEEELACEDGGNVYQHITYVVPFDFYIPKDYKNQLLLLSVNHYYWVFLR